MAVVAPSLCLPCLPQSTLRPCLCSASSAQPRTPPPAPDKKEVQCADVLGSLWQTLYYGPLERRHMIKRQQMNVAGLRNATSASLAVAEMVLQNTGSLPEDGRVTSILQLGEISDIMSRDLTPLDYELLLSLDEISVQPEAKRKKAIERARLAGVDMLSRTRGDSATGETCAICLTNFEMEDDDIRQLPCEHLFHRHCIAQWLTKRNLTCPICNCEALPAVIDDEWEAYLDEEAEDSTVASSPGDAAPSSSLSSSSSSRSPQESTPRGGCRASGLAEVGPDVALPAVSSVEMA